MLGVPTLCVLVMLPGLPRGKNVLLMVADDLGNQVILIDWHLWKDEFLTSIALNYMFSKFLHGA